MPSSKAYNRAYYLKDHPDAGSYNTMGPRPLFAVCHSKRSAAHSNGLCQSCYNRSHKYGADFLTMYQDQEGLCKICAMPYDERALNVDHNHSTGKKRGLVCNSCNRLIASAENSLLSSVLAYLKDYE